jgi:hypothetical protein
MMSSELEEPLSTPRRRHSAKMSVESEEPEELDGNVTPADFRGILNSGVASKSESEELVLGT